MSMGMGSAGTPPWVDEEEIDEEKKQKKEISEHVNRIKALEKENATLKKRIKQLEDELKKAKK
jgi:septal ring factor EnvC (AmiA/AmiB activator)